MSAKRKRSIGSLVTNSTFEASSPTPYSNSPTRLPNFFVQSKTHEAHASPSAWKQSSHHHHQQQQEGEEEDRTPQTLNSRTRKRYRDGRPEEAQIHGS
ncbi:hypothetical protein QM012_005058 [Aureobasidium pullulans]|uniref:Uncharacterized protein n=1 Tax=Aureobasidium pullulans TaxID=5580 RepID=A0ABR0T6A0_AURPU